MQVRTEKRISCNVVRKIRKEERDMRQNFSVNLAILMQEIVNIILHSEEIDSDECDVWCNINDNILLVTWADLMDIRDSPDVNKSLRDEIQEFMVERGKA